MAQLWGGRFSGDTDPVMAEFNSSLPFDYRLWRADIAGSIAWARAICASGLLSVAERDEIVAGLEALCAELAADSAHAFATACDEDIHSFVERNLTERIGPVAGKLHTGRSRNDQVATDTRLWMRDQLTDLDAALTRLIEASVERAEAEIDFLMPGYTHLQPAQPIRWSHWLLSHAWPWMRDLERLRELASRVNVCPLGSGALAGCPFPIDREALAADLGFWSVSPNSLDAVSDRDFIVEFLSWAALLGIHLSRWSEDLIIWSSREFGFISLSDAFSTGSSLMPQKKNPDSLELLRGKSGRLVGGLAGLLVTLKGLPSSYDKDLQEDKEALFDATDTLRLALHVARGVMRTLTPNAEKMRAALSDELLATDLADALVREGVPFRQSHHLVGLAVRMAESSGRRLSQLTLADLQTISVSFAPAAMEIWDFERSVERRAVTGGTAKAEVLAQAHTLRALLKAEGGESDR
jgi:argininosuccinate lyase